MRTMVVVLASVWASALPAIAEEGVLEYPLARAIIQVEEPGFVRVDASGGKIVLELPDPEPEFATTEDLVKYMVETYNAVPVYNEAGECVDWTLKTSVQGPAMVFDGTSWSEVDDPVMTLVAGLDGYVRVEGTLECVNPFVCGAVEGAARMAQSSSYRIPLTCSNLVCAGTSSGYTQSTQVIISQYRDRRYWYGVEACTENPYGMCLKLRPIVPVTTSTLVVLGNSYYDDTLCTVDSWIDSFAVPHAYDPVNVIFASAITDRRAIKSDRKPATAWFTYANMFVGNATTATDDVIVRTSPFCAL